MLKIETSIYPFRVKLSDKKPVQLKVNIRNMNDEDVLLSYDVLTSKALSIDKGGFKTSLTTKVGKMEPGERTEAYFEIYPKTMTREGTYPILIRATEHYDSYTLVEKEYKKKIEIKVDA